VGEPNKTALRRILEIDRLIRDGGNPSSTELAAHFEVTARTIYRDLAYLRDQLNAPLAWHRQSDTIGGYYYTDPSYALPANFIRRQEMTGLLLAGKLVEVAKGQPRGAAFFTLVQRLRKLLSEDDLLIIDNEVSAFDYVARRTRFTLSSSVEMVGHALRNRKQITGSLYIPEQGNWERFSFETYNLVNLNGAWYLLGRLIEKDERRAIPLNRVRGLKETEESYSVPKNFTLNEALDDAFGFNLSGEPYRVRLRFRGQAAQLVAEREWHASQRLLFEPDGRLTLTLQTTHLEELSRWVIGFGSEVEILGPEALRRICRRRLTDFIATNPALAPQ
jgi:predicted DNA-binding transcriptional regulator YafY